MSQSSGCRRCAYGVFAVACGAYAVWVAAVHASLRHTHSDLQFPDYPFVATVEWGCIDKDRSFYGTVWAGEVTYNPNQTGAPALNTSVSPRDRSSKQCDYSVPADDPSSSASFVLVEGVTYEVQNGTCRVKNENLAAPSPHVFQQSDGTITYIGDELVEVVNRRCAHWQTKVGRTCFHFWSSEDGPCKFGGPHCADGDDAAWPSGIFLYYTHVDVDITSPAEIARPPGCREAASACDTPCHGCPQCRNYSSTADVQGQCPFLRPTSLSAQATA